MSSFFIIFCYILVAYGACNVIAFGDGPFYIFSKIRSIANNISEHFGKLFTCMMCLPANFGWICSVINWFFIPIAFTPFNIIFNGYANLWWLALLCDGAFTTGIVYLLYILNDLMEKRIEFLEQNIYRTEYNTEGFDVMSDYSHIVEDISELNKHKNGER